MPKPDQCLIPVLGDQLSLALPSLLSADKARSVVMMAEVMAEATYVRHHLKKLVFCFSAMRHFAERLRADGWAVDYVTLDDPANSHSLKGEIGRACARHRFLRNPRMANICRGYGKFDDAEKARIRESAAAFLGKLEPWLRPQPPSAS